MKILHTEASCGWGGQEIRILSEAAGLLERGHDVRLVCPATARIHQEAQRRGVPVAGLPIGKKRLAGLRALRAYIRDFQPDVVNTHSSTDTWLTALASLGLPNKPALVRTRHISAPIPKSPASRWLYQRASRHVVTTGERLRGQVMREAGVPAERVTSIPTGIDLARFAPGDRGAARRQLGLDPWQRYIGIVATLRSWKGHAYLLEALARLETPTLKLLIVGDGPQRENLREQVRQLGLEGQVVFAGNQDDVVPYLHSLDMFALPSYANEGVPQALLQAMACGLPCISTPVGSIDEVIDNERNGLLVAPRDPDALAGAIERLLADPALAARLATAARERIVERYARPAMLDAMEALFRRVSG